MIRAVESVPCHRCAGRNYADIVHPAIWRDDPRVVLWSGRRPVQVDLVLPARIAPGRLWFHGPSFGLEPPNYGLLAEWKREQAVYYQQRGGGQGEWLLVTRPRPGLYHLYASCYGCCDDCDPLIRFVVRRNESVDSFARYYKPARLLINEPLFNPISPWLLEETAGVGWQHLDYEEAAIQLSAAVAFLEDLTPTVGDILHSRNVEVRRVLLERMGNEEFVRQANPVVIDQDGRGQQLLAIGDMAFIRVFCNSTQREYILRVPPTTRSVTAGRAWTFGKTAIEFEPEVET